MINTPLANLIFDIILVEIIKKVKWFYKKKLLGGAIIWTKSIISTASFIAKEKNEEKKEVVELITLRANQKPR